MTAATAIAHDEGRALRGRVGILGLIVAEISLFAVFVVAYLFYIGKSLNGPYAVDVLELPVPGTICLLSSSISAGCSRSATRGSRASVWISQPSRASRRSIATVPSTTK